VFVLNCGTYQAFLEKMRNPAATDIVKAIKNFLNDFGASPPDAERDSERVQVRLRGPPCDCAGLTSADARRPGRATAGRRF
jgi:hypothetical protein